MSKNRDIEMARYLAGEMSTHEEIDFLNKAGSTQKQRSELKDMEKHWKYFDKNPAREQWDTSGAWKQLHHKLESEGLLEESPLSSEGGRRMSLLRIAATVLLVLALGIPSLFFGLIRDTQSSQMSQPRRGSSSPP